MNFVEKIKTARTVLQELQRISIRALGRQLELDGDELEEIVEELVDAQQIAKLEGKVLVWVSDANSPLAQPRAADVRGYTPRHLANKILASRSAMEGEKKQVTVLFCDVAGSMNMAEALGPEAWHDTLNQFFEVLTSSVHEFEGTVNQYTGDGIMALFGAPIAAEEHARRACMAALAIQQNLESLRERIHQQHGQTFAARIGINSGEVVVGKIGDDLRMDYTAQGQVVGIAARLEALAEADSTLISAHTQKQVAGFFDLHAQGAKAIKGVNQPLEVFQLGASQAETTRFDVSRRQGLTQFIGREADMATLEAALQQAKAGNGQVVGVVAEAGTGKSRLCYEFLETCKARGMTVLQGHALSHGKNIPFLPMLQVFRAYYGITDDDDDRTAREKIAGRLILLDEKFRDYLPVQFEFFGIADPETPPLQIAPEAKQRQLISVLRQIVQGADPNIGNIIAYIEDLHWLDEGSEGFLNEWVDALAGTNSFLLVNFRPEYRAGWMQKTWYRQLPLAPLSPDEVQQMLIALIGPEPSVSGLAKLIFQRTGGNPFFCEEVVKSLQESGALQGSSGQYVLTDTAADLDIPQSVQAVLAARIDRLAEDAKDLLQTAAVIGRVFSRGLLAEVCDQPEAAVDRQLAALKDGEFIFLRSQGLGEDYIFKHALTQEVALGSQLAEKLKATHARVAQAVESLNQDKPEEMAPLIANHWEQAGEALTAAQWYMRSADHLGGSDIAQSMRQRQDALRLTAALPDSVARNTCRVQALATLLNSGSWRVQMGRKELDQYYQEAQSLMAGLEDADTAGAITGGYAVAVGLGYGDLATWGRLTDELANAGEHLSPEMRYAVLGANRGYFLFVQGQLREQISVTGPMIAELAGDYSVGRISVGFSVLGQISGVTNLSRAYRGELAGALADEEIVLKQMEQLQFTEEYLWGVGNLLDIHYQAGRVKSDDADFMQTLKSATQLAQQQASDFTRLNLQIYAAHVPLLAGDAQRALAEFDACLKQCREQHASMEQEASILAGLAEAHGLNGDAEQAAQTARAGIARAQEQGARLYEIRNHLALARALIQQASPESQDEIQHSLNAATALVEQTDAQALKPQIIELRGRFAVASGKTDTARSLLEDAHRLYRELGADGHAERLAAELGL